MRLSPIALAAALITGAAVSAIAQPRHASNAIDSIALTRSDGSITRIQPGRINVVEVFATWCQYSAYAAQYLAPDFARYVTVKGGRFLAVDETDRLGLGTAGPFGHSELGADSVLAPLPGLDRDAEYRATLAAFRAAYDVPYEVAFDPTMRLRAWLRPVLGDAMAYPMFVFIDDRGQFVTRALGVHELATLEQTFDDITSDD
jgi:hypothetical protein